MKLELDTQDFNREHWSGEQYSAPFKFEILEPLNDWEEHAQDLITQEILKSPEFLRTNQIFTLLAVPFTILDPSKIPQEPNLPDYPVGQEVFEAWRTNLEEHFGPWEPVSDVASYALTFLPPHVPFTVMGFWREDYHQPGFGNAAGYFGFSSSQPDRLVVLFA